MTTTPKALVQAKFAEAAETTQYISKECKTSLDKVTATNVTAENAVISVSIVAAGGAAGNSNRITFEQTVAPKKAVTFNELVGHIMEPGDFISTLASEEEALVFKVSGRQFI